MARTNFLWSISTAISHYLSPQIYQNIFSGRADLSISTKRKKLTIFFSDIKDFTSTTERLQSEELTSLLNEYFTEMSTIALQYGGTIDKFVGDAMLVFFGDPDTKGVQEDAEASLRMGINTGFCNVGNFGSADRMDYTIIGAEANLAACSCAISSSHALPPITVKGIGREIVPYAIDGLGDGGKERGAVFSAHGSGLDLYLDVDALDPSAASHAEAVMRDAIEALDRRTSNEVKDER